MINLTWDELADLFNDQTRLDGAKLSKDSYRKPYENARDWFEDVFSYMMNDNHAQKELVELRQELFKEKVKINDERSSLKKILRDEARLETTLNLLERQIKKNSSEHYPPIKLVETDASNNDLIVTLSDLHIGLAFDSMIGRYDSDIAQKRMSQYLQDILKIQLRHKSENCQVVLMGDLISGNIHKTVAIANRENVIEQIMTVSKLVSWFIYELSKIFNKVYVCGVSGNHSRIDRKDDALKDERLDALPLWYISVKLEHLDNVRVNITQPDNTIALFNVRGKKYCAVHGDYDSITQSGVLKLCSWLGFDPYAILYGHMHHPAYNEFNGVKAIQVGSLAGCGDDYTLQKRLKGSPSQTALVCNEDGIEAIYNIEFNK